MAEDLSGLVFTRPSGAHPNMRLDLPNETGAPNHDPAGLGLVDNHDVLTGSDGQGRLYGSSGDSTCSDWTSASPSGRPRVGHSFIRTGTSSALESWLSAHDAPGCAAGGKLVETGLPGADERRVGGSGGYGALYCFALAE